MINSEGKRVREISAARAAQHYRMNPSNPEMLIRADIMTCIDRNSMLGEIAYTYFSPAGNTLSQETIDWLVELGYRIVCNTHLDHLNRTCNTYTVYWAYPPGSIEVFSPGISHRHF